MQIAGLMSLFVLVLAGIPIYIAIFVGAVIILVLGLHMDPIIPMGVMFGRLNNTSLLAVPLFIVLGQFLAAGGAGKSLIRFMNGFLGHLPGGPAYALIIANMALAAMCASPIAGIAAFGPVMIPMMLGLGYSEKFTYGLLICSAILEPLIPPSILPIIFAYISGGLVPEPVSVTTLWTASFLPGIMIACLLGVTVYIYARRGHLKKLPRADWPERLVALREAWAILLMPIVVLAPLYIGWATPTEAASIGLVYTILIGVFVYKGLNLKTAWGSMRMTMYALGMVFCLMTGALLLTVALTATRIPYEFSDWLAGLGLSWWVFMIFVTVLFILLGMFLDPAAIILISVPLLLPSVVNLGISIIVFGVFTCIAVNLANITPPYGMMIFAAQGILKKPYEFIVQSVLMFIPAVVLGMIIIAFVPVISTWLPDITGR